MSDDVINNNTTGDIKDTLLKRILRKKNVDHLIEATKSGHGLKKTLGATQLILLGIGAIIGAGIFTLVGTAIAGTPTSPAAGPGLIVSLIFAGIACALSALCYAEFAAMIPVAGSAYTYTYVTLGQFIAWMVGWVLMLEYAIGNITLACSWSDYFFEFIRGFKFLPTAITHPPYWLVYSYEGASAKYASLHMQPDWPIVLGIPICIPIPAICITWVITYLLYIGISESVKINNIMVIVKSSVILVFIAIGIFYVKPTNWEPFFPNGWNGIFAGAFTMFFAYIGFDTLATTAEETKNPEKDLPIGIIGSLAICTLVYIFMVAVLTGIMPQELITAHAPIAAAMNYIGHNWVAGIISIGALAGITSVFIVMQLGTTRILYAMARDGLLPQFLNKVHHKFKTPHVITILTGTLVSIGTVMISLEEAARLCNIGTFSAFMVVCLGVAILRFTDPGRRRPFRCPGAPAVPILGVIISLLLVIQGMPFKTTIMFFCWLTLGVILYFAYGYWHARIEKGH